MEHRAKGRARPPPRMRRRPPRAASRGLPSRDRLRRASARWGPVHQRDDEEDEEEAHDERECTKITRLCRLHIAVPLAGWIGFPAGPRRIIAQPQLPSPRQPRPERSPSQAAGMFPTTRTASRANSTRNRSVAPMKSRRRGRMSAGSSLDQVLGHDAPYRIVIFVRLPVGVALTWMRQPASPVASMT